jgi:tetratricopeptide (TPR) repeat protein
MPRRPSRHVDDPAAVGRRLREARQAAGLTQRELSFDGCTAAYVSRIEAGARVPSLQVLTEFARRLGVSAEYLATGATEFALSSEFLDAELALRLGEEARARLLYESARDKAESPAVLARAQLGLGQLALRRGEMNEGIALLEQALQADALGAGDASTAANALGRGYVAQGRFEAAFAVFGRSLEDARARGDQFDEVRFAVLLANAYIDHGDFGAAHAALGAVLDVARKTVDPLLRASLYWSQSRACLAQGHPDAAAEHAQLAIATLKATEQTLEAARALLLLARIENDRGNPRCALELVDEGGPAVAAAGETTAAAMFTVERARALAAVGEPEQAAALLLGVVPQLDSAAPGSAADAYRAAADAFRRQGDTARALELYELAIDRAPVPNRDTADSLTAMAEIYEERGDARKALELLKRALAARNGVIA